MAKTTLRNDFDLSSHDGATEGLKLGGVLVTSTAAEINIMDGVTASAAELSILTGATVTTDELNILDDTVEDVSIVYTTGTNTDDIDVAITVLDAAGVAIDAVHKLEVFITDDDIGGVLTSTSASGALTATGGAVLSVLTAVKHLTVTTAATGILGLNLIDSANTAGERFCVVNPVNGKVIVGPSTVAGDYQGG